MLCFQCCVASQVDKDLLNKLQQQRSSSFEDVATETTNYLGLQTCINCAEETLEILATSVEELQLALLTIKHLADPDIEQASHETRLHHGLIEWSFKGEIALAMFKLFQEPIIELVTNYSMKCKIQTPEKEFDWPISAQSASEHSGSATADKDASLEQNLQKIDLSKLIADIDYERLEVTCNLHSKSQHLHDVITEIQRILDLFQTLHKDEVCLPMSKDDDFRQKACKFIKEVEGKVMCFTEERKEGTCKLVIKSLDASTCDKAKQEFLSLFCKSKF